MKDLFGDDVDFDAKPSPVDEEPFHEYVQPDLYDWLNAIKYTKDDLRVAYTISKRGRGANKKVVNVAPDPELKSLNMFQLLRGLDQSDVARPFAHMMNERPYLTKEQQYLFLLTSIPSHSSYDRWIVNKNDKRLKKLCDLMCCSLEKAKEFFVIYTSAEIDVLIKQCEGDNNAKRN